VEPRGLEPLTPCLQSGGVGLVERRSCLASREGAHPEPLNRAFVAAVSCCRFAAGAGPECMGCQYNARFPSLPSAGIELVAVCDRQPTPSVACATAEPSGEGIGAGDSRRDGPEDTTGKNPTIAIIRLEASNAVEPTYLVNAPAASLHPSRTTVSQISSRSANSPVA
jgi:hypothetical protein